MTTPYRRIMRAARMHKGLRLSAAECVEMSRDDAIEQLARNDDESELHPDGCFEGSLSPAVSRDCQGDGHHECRNCSRYADGVVKWVGGKTRLLPELMRRMPESFGRYFEPFAGGAALFFRVEPEHAMLGDDNRDLVNLYRTVGAHVDDVIRRLGVHRSLHCEAHYYEMRARWNDPTASWTNIDRAAAFVYLNKTCFNGLWRVNRAGHFNVPMGRYEDPPICAVEELRAASGVLRRARLHQGHYRDAVGDACAGDFVYFDPPYDPATPTANFTGYTAGAFGPDDQRELADLARGLVARGVHVMLSNSDTPFVRSLYKGFRIDRVKCGRSINSNAAKRGSVAELIITSEELPCRPLSRI